MKDVVQRLFPQFTNPTTHAITDAAYGRGVHIASAGEVLPALLGPFQGIVVPMVNTVEEAKVAIAATKYPPVGNRSLGGGMQSLNFGAEAGEYFAKANDEILVVLQTESPTGVESAPEIYSLPGVDAIFVGPVDLRANMRAADGFQSEIRLSSSTTITYRPR